MSSEINAKQSAALAIRIGAAQIELRLSGAIFLPDLKLLAVADLHLGRSERVARRGGALLPPYESEDTLERLSAEIEALAPDTVLCLGDSFDDDAAAAALPEATLTQLCALGRDRCWIWITGNHDPAPRVASGESCAEAVFSGVVFRHIAADHAPSNGEASGHYHPKAQLKTRGRRLSRRCFLASSNRLILPAFGAYTGGLDIRSCAFDPLFPDGATAYLLGRSQFAAIAR